MFESYPISLTQDDFADSQWYSIILGCPQKEFYLYTTAFLRAAENETKKTRKIAYCILSKLCFLPMSFEDSRFPFSNNQNSLDETHREISKFVDNYLDVLEDWLPEINDSDLKSRIADIVWIKKRNRNALEIAVNSYLVRSREMIVERTPISQIAIRLERSMQLSMSMGKENAIQDKTRKEIEEIVSDAKKYDQNPCIKTLNLFLTYSIGDPLLNAKLCLDLANSQNMSWDIRRAHWNLSIGFLDKGIRSQGPTTDVDIESLRLRVMKMYATSYFEEAKEVIGQPDSSHDNFYVVDLLKRAKESISNFNLWQDAEISKAELDNMIVQHQKKGARQIPKTELELPDVLEDFRNVSFMVSEKTFQEAISAIATQVNVVPVKKLEQIQEDVPLGILRLVPRVLYNHDGRIVEQSPSFISSKQEEIEKAKKNERLEMTRLFQQQIAENIILPAINLINAQNHVSLRDWLSILEYSPFVPVDRTEIYMIGLHAGLCGRWIECVHLLVPQVENSIRYVLAKHGVITFRWGHDNEDDYPLSKIAYAKDNPISKIFGEDIAFTIKSLLLERFGSNLRNYVAHGLVGPDYLASWRAVYLWWLCLHLCFLCPQKID